MPPPDLLPDLRTYGSGAPDDDTYLHFALDVVRRADEFGFDVTLVAERFMGPDLEAWVLASTLAANTSNITIMPAVHPGILNPQIVAKMASTLDRVSGGRAAINIVNGWWEQEFQNFSNGQWLADRDARYRRMDEFLHVLHRLWTEDSVTHEGEFYSTDGLEMPPKPPADTPLIFGASSSVPGRRAMAQYGHVWFLGPSGQTSTLREYDANIARELDFVSRETTAMRASAAEFGRTIRCGSAAMVVVGDTEAEALATVDVLEQYATRGFLEAVSVGGAAIYGTPQQVADRIHALSEAGIDLLMLKFAPMRQGLEQFGTKVMPLIRDLTARES
jgi:FMNH2-dependent dimethyl sulfone monooxygenase